jgi:hypothetical protein
MIALSTMGVRSVGSTMEGPTLYETLIMRIKGIKGQLSLSSTVPLSFDL